MPTDGQLDCRNRGCRKARHLTTEGLLQHRCPPLTRNYVIGSSFSRFCFHNTPISQGVTTSFTIVDHHCQFVSLRYIDQRRLPSKYIIYHVDLQSWEESKAFAGTRFMGIHHNTIHGPMFFFSPILLDTICIYFVHFLFLPVIVTFPSKTFKQGNHESSLDDPIQCCHPR